MHLPIFEIFLPVAQVIVLSPPHLTLAVYVLVVNSDLDSHLDDVEVGIIIEIHVHVYVGLIFIVTILGDRENSKQL